MEMKANKGPVALIFGFLLGVLVLVLGVLGLLYNLVGLRPGLLGEGPLLLVSLDP